MILNAQKAPGWLSFKGFECGFIKQFIIGFYEKMGLFNGYF